MTTAIIFDIILLALLIAAGITLNNTWNEKEKYRCRLFDLTNGKDGNHFVQAPDIPPPPAPVGMFPTRPRERDERTEKSRKETEDFRKEIYKSSLGRVNISHIHEGKFFYDGMNFSVEVNNGKLIYTDKETGNKIIKEL